ncbi:hypothetical protein [Streptomyces sp. NPDC060194]|uniref:RsiG family protein n=1 Tax=Streptomyces sp. NPDC060194 TaxID=3347069 RepID=UPI00365CE0B7
MNAGTPPGGVPTKRGTGSYRPGARAARPPEDTASARGAAELASRPPAQRSAPGPAGAAAPPPDLSALRLSELRDLRRRAQQDEADLSYVRRLLHGRIDILRAETDRRRDPAAAGPAGADLLAALSAILVDPPSAHRASARHVTLSTPRGARYRELAAGMLDEVELSDLTARTDEELHAGTARLVRHEQEVSRLRQRLQRTADDCGAEIARRYRDGEAHVDDLLP